MPLFTVQLLNRDGTVCANFYQRDVKSPDAALIYAAFGASGSR